MIGYVVIMFLASLMFGTVSMRIYRGQTNLIHEYHQNNITDKAAYGKAFGKALGVFTLAFALSGVLALFEILFITGLIVLGIGLVGGTVAILRVQKKYNNGIF